jgi:hypothetical protein
MTLAGTEGQNNGRNRNGRAPLSSAHVIRVRRTIPATIQVRKSVLRGAAARGDIGGVYHSTPGRIALGVVPFCRRDSGYVEVLGVLQLNVCAKRFIEHFTGLLLSARSIGHGLFDADDLMAFRALAGAMTGAVHFVFWPKPTHVGQFWLFHAPSFPQARQFGYPLDIQTDSLTHARPPRTIRFLLAEREEYAWKAMVLPPCMAI